MRGVRLKLGKLTLYFGPVRDSGRYPHGETQLVSVHFTVNEWGDRLFLRCIPTAWKAEVLPLNYTRLSLG